MTDNRAMNNGITLEIPARPEYLSLVRAVVSAAAALDPGLGEQRIDDLRLAVSEATTNAIEAHADLGSQERIAIRCSLAGDRIEVEVRDRGLGYEGESLDDSTLNSPSKHSYEGGFGIPLMRVLADELRIQTLDEGTAVQLIVYTSPVEKED